MSEETPETPVLQEDENEESERYPELAELQREIDRRIRDNQKFLDHFLDEDFPEEEVEEDNGPDDMEPEL